MAQNYYPSSEHKPKTMTVGELMRKLNTLDPNLPVIFRSPQYGAFGSLTTYSIDGTDMVTMEARSQTYPARIDTDEETGERRLVEEWTDHFAAWAGVVIT